MDTRKLLNFKLLLTKDEDKKKNTDIKMIHVSLKEHKPRWSLLTLVTYAS